MSRLATAVIGLGAMGRHHARLLAAHPEADLVACCDSDAERAAAIAAERGGEAITSAAELPERLDAVVVSTPTSSHLEIAEPLLRRGVACLVEKPIAASLDEADALLAAAEAGGAVLAVGHAERFNPGLLQVRELLSDPIFVECHRLGVFPDRSLDVDVVLDLMVHDLDLLRWISQSELEEVAAIGVNVVTPRVDIANARLVFGSGLTANLTCSRVSAEVVRKLRIFSEARYVSVDLREQSAEVVELGTGGGIAAIERRVLQPEEKDEPLRLELADFLTAVRGEAPPMVSGADGRAALAGALRVMTAMEEQVADRKRRAARLASES